MNDASHIVNMKDISTMNAKSDFNSFNDITIFNMHM